MTASRFIRPPALSSSNCQHRGQALAILRVHRAQHALIERFGQIADQVGEIVDLHALGGGDQLLGIHAADQLGAHFLVELDEHVAFESGSTNSQTISRLAGGSDSISEAISAGCIELIMRCPWRMEPCSSALRSAASRVVFCCGGFGHRAIRSAANCARSVAAPRG